MNRREWHRAAAEFEDAIRDATVTSGDQLAELVRRAKPSRHKVLVDAGCGIGSFVRRFGRRFGQVIAFDFAAGMVARARKRCVSLQHVTWLNLPLEDAREIVGSVGDFVVCLNVITSPRAALRKQHWSSLAQLTRPGGYLLTLVPSLESGLFVKRIAGETDEVRASDLRRGLLYRGDTKQKHYRQDELRRAITRRGLTVVSLRRIHYPWAEEGLDESFSKRPWEWICLAKRRSESM